MCSMRLHAIRPSVTPAHKKTIRSENRDRNKSHVLWNEPDSRLCLHSRTPVTSHNRQIHKQSMRHTNTRLPTRSFIRWCRIRVAHVLLPIFLPSLSRSCVAYPAHTLSRYPEVGCNPACRSHSQWLLDSCPWSGSSRPDLSPSQVFDGGVGRKRDFDPRHLFGQTGEAWECVRTTWELPLRRVDIAWFFHDVSSPLVYRATVLQHESLSVTKDKCIDGKKGRWRVSASNVFSSVSLHYRSMLSLRSSLFVDWFIYQVSLGSMWTVCCCYFEQGGTGVGGYMRLWSWWVRVLVSKANA